MAGYKGYSMSNNAIACYEENIKPISKWSKIEILNLIENNYSSIFQNAKKLNLNQLKELFLKLNSWHHTSCKYNKTNFYEFDYELEIEKLKNDIEDFNSVKKIKAESKETKEVKYITALVKFYAWEGSKKYPKKVEYIEVVKYMSDEKMVKTYNGGNKRLSSLEILDKIEQKTKYNDGRKWKL